MNGLGAWMGLLGRLLLRCLVGKYGTLLLTGTLAVLVGAGAYLTLVYDDGESSGADQGTVYSVAAVDANLANDPGSWLGRTIQIRGEVVPCIVIPSVSNGSCAVLTADSGGFYGLKLDGFSQSMSATANTLPVVRAGLDPVRTIMRRLPLLGRLAPAPQVLQWGVVATYRVQLVSVPNSFFDASTEAILLDSAP